MQGLAEGSPAMFFLKKTLSSRAFLCAPSQLHFQRSIHQVKSRWGLAVCLTVSVFTLIYPFHFAFLTLAWHVQPISRIRSLPVILIASLGLALKVLERAFKHQFHHGIALSSCRLIWKLSKSPCSCCVCLMTANVRAVSSACWCFCSSWGCNSICYSCVWNIHIPS